MGKPLVFHEGHWCEKEQLGSTDWLMSGSFVLIQYQHLTSKNTAVYLAKFHYDDARQQIQSDSKTKDEGTLKQHDTVVIVPAEEDNFHPIATQNLTDSLDT